MFHVCFIPTIALLNGDNQAQYYEAANPLVFVAVPPSDWVVLWQRLKHPKMQPREYFEYSTEILNSEQIIMILLL